LRTYFIINLCGGYATSKKRKAFLKLAVNKEKHSENEGFQKKKSILKHRKIRKLAKLSSEGKTLI
jgi:hypothetical protein